MGARNNPIKFGPEWLRNLATDPNRNSQISVNSNNSGGGSGNSSNNASNSTTAQPTQTPKIHLAKQRYGKEEMLALYDRNCEASADLKGFEELYDPRGKPPLALNNFDDEMRDNARGGGIAMQQYSPSNSSLVNDRGRGRGLVTSLRPHQTGRGLPRHRGLDDNMYGEPSASTSTSRPWGGNSTVASSGYRNGMENSDWNSNPSKPYRRYQGNVNTNWRRQHSGREEDGEWRTSENARNRPHPHTDKWDKDSDRRGNERPQSWNPRNQRRVWVPNETDESLPEWAVDTMDTCGGTFDSAGEFHGFSNDDSNVPRNIEENIHTLTRSQTHGNFSRSKSAEEDSEEWWASEKAKKLSPMKFDAPDIKFKKSTIGGPEPSTSKKTLSEAPSVTEGTTKEIKILQRGDDNSGNRRNVPSFETSDKFSSESGDKKMPKRKHFLTKTMLQSKTFDTLMRSDINVDEANDEGGDFNSVLIAPNNSLRQKHQNIVSPSRCLSPAMQFQGRIKVESINTSDKLSLDEGFLDMSLDDGPPKHNAISSAMSMTQDNSISTSMIHMQPDHSMASHRDQLSAQRDISAQSMLGPAVSGSGMSSSLLSNVGVSNLSMPMSGMVPGLQAMAGMPGISSTGMSLPGMGSVRMSLSSISGLSGNSMPSSMPSGLSGNMMGSGALGNASMSSGLAQGNVGLSGGGMVSISSPGMSNVIPAGALPPGSLLPSGLPNTSMPPPDIIPSNIMPQSGLSGMGMPPPVGGLQNSGMSLSGMSSSGMATGIPPPSGLQSSGINTSGLSSVIGNMGMQNSSIQSGPRSSTLGLNNSGMIPAGFSSGIQNATGLPNYMSVGVGNLQGSNVGANSLFMNSINRNNAISPPSNLQSEQSHSGRSTLFPMHGMQQQQPSQNSFGPSMFNNAMSQPQQPANLSHLWQQWYYEDPKKNIQGPFSSKDMYGWFKAGFFTADLMVRRAYEMQMKPLCLYGQVPPFVLDVMSQPYAQSTMDHRAQANQDPLLDMGLEDSLWSQPPPSTSADVNWMQQPMNTRNESRINSLPIYYWDQQTSISTNIIPDGITKEMKTEEQILAQLRSVQNKRQQSQTNNDEFIAEASSDSALIDNDNDVPQSKPKPLDEKPDNKKLGLNITLPFNTANMPAANDNKTAKPPAKNDNFEKNSKHKDNNGTKNKNKSKGKEEKVEETKAKEEDYSKIGFKEAEKKPDESLFTQSVKREEKPSKKDLEREKKEWIKEGFTIVKGADKGNKELKELKKQAEEAKLLEEMERKRKLEEKFAFEEEKKKKQTEAYKKLQFQQTPQEYPIYEVITAPKKNIIPKSPWSTIPNQNTLAVSKEGLTLSEIQRLEREKKMEQMKEQQQMMQILAQQQQAALAREQEAQASLGWGKKKTGNMSSSIINPSFIEIQAETRKAATSSMNMLSNPPPPAPIGGVTGAIPTGSILLDDTSSIYSTTPWGGTQNGGFWERPTRAPEPVPPNPTEKVQESKPQAVEQNKIKKNPTAPPPTQPAPKPKETTSPNHEFENWCSNMLTSWSSKVDVPTFIGFLKDIESPYEVKDYVKCYLGDTKESNDFFRQFLEKRSKLLRVATAAPVDDLCSPAAAINPRNNSNSDYQEVKGKGKKTKKNKMLKVDARILGFSVTASEDRINVGDIDTA